jgi:hypothetical protein
VQNGINLVFTQCEVEQRSIAKLPNHEGNPERLLDQFGMAVDQVIEHDRLMPSSAQGAYGVAADIASSPCDQHPHFV